MSQPATTDPIAIMLINMTIVFSVLWGLSLVIRLIRYIDPTRKKTASEKPAVSLQETSPIAATTETQKTEDDLEVAAVIAAALASYGYQARQIVAIRPVGGQSWARNARLETVNTRNQMS